MRINDFDFLNGKYLVEMIILSYTVNHITRVVNKQ